MNILVIGSGGREHAFAWKIKQSVLCSKLYVAPGNPGTAELGTNVPISVNEFEKLGHFCVDHQIGLVVVGPEIPLVEGIVDYFKSRADLEKILIIGPSAQGAQLEGSKDFSKSFMKKYDIPTASSHTFTSNDYDEAVKYIENHSLPIVIKADGLAAGKGVVIAETLLDAHNTLKDILLHNKFGKAGAKVVIEEFLKGIELSVFILTDGEHYALLPEAKDYKRIGEGDTGLNTGGMGAVSPVPFANETFMNRVEKEIIVPTLQGLKQEQIDYSGFIFFGLMNVDGAPYVIEYNARMGDPETEVVLPRMDADLVELLVAAGKKELSKNKLMFKKEAATTIVLVAGGYPEEYKKGDEIRGLKEATDVVVFHAGTSRVGDKLLTNGGRVLALTALAENWETALDLSRTAAEKISWEDRYFRKDIGFDLKKRIKIV